MQSSIQNFFRILSLLSFAVFLFVAYYSSSPIYKNSVPFSKMFSVWFQEYRRRLSSQLLICRVLAVFVTFSFFFSIFRNQPSEEIWLWAIGLVLSIPCWLPSSRASSCKPIDSPACPVQELDTVPHYYTQPQSITEYEDTVTSGSTSDSTDVPPPTPPISSPPPRTGISFGRLLISIFLSFACGIFLTAFVLTENIQQEYEKQWLGGYGTGKDAGYQIGYTDGSAKAQQSYDEGYKKGHADGYDDGHEDGYDYGYDTGYDKGRDDGYDKGYSDALEAISSSIPSYSSYSSSGTSSSSGTGVSGSGSFITPSTDQSYTVYVTNTGKKYHRAGCSYLKKSSNPMSLSSAKAAGYTPCSRCNPPY